jgi:hypothetical protein
VVVGRPPKERRTDAGDGRTRRPWVKADAALRRNIGLERYQIRCPAEPQAHDVERQGELLRLHVDVNRAVPPD